MSLNVPQIKLVEMGITIIFQYLILVNLSDVIRSHNSYLKENKQFVFLMTKLISHFKGKNAALF